MDRLSRQKHIDIYRYLAFASVGGFFAGYAVLCRMGVLANAQTMNLVELVLNALTGHGANVLWHLGSFVVYVAGTMLTVLLPHFFHCDVHRLCPLISGLMAILLACLPEDMNAIVSLYPIFFAMSFQWSAFTGADGFYSSTIFSTNNTKQTSLALAEYLCDGDRTHLRKVRFYFFTLVCFHIGVTIAFFATKYFGIPASLLVMPQLIWCYVLVTCEERSPVLAIA